MSNVAINIAAEFKGKKAFKQAETSADKLNKRVGALAKTLVGLYSARKIVAFSTASVKAFAEDEKAAASLGQTLKNLNLAYGSNVGTVNGFISRLEMQTGVLDDELRPAMDRLLRATGDVAKSQELLGLALDIAAGTGKSLTQVSQSLQKAYLGQTQALGRLGVGLSKAELTSSSFAEIQTRLNELFAGQATTAANTYAGSLNKLTVAGNNAKETIGKGLVDAFVTITNSSSVDDLVTKIDTAANAIANFVRETAKFIQITKDIFKFELFAPSGGLFNTGKGFGNISMSVSSQDTQKADKAAAAKAQAAQLKNAQALTKSSKESLKLAKARAIFDLQKIQIEAALKGKISKEDEIRLKLMKAIEDENLSGIEKYQKALETAQTKTKELTTLLETVKTLEVKDPFGTWSVDPLTAAINELTKSIGGVGTQIQASGKEWSSFANTVATTVIRPNLSEWNSSFSNASAATAAAAKTASESIAAAQAVASAAIAKSAQESTSALQKLKEETATSMATQTKAIQDAIVSSSSGTNVSTLESFRIAEAATAAASSSSNINVTVQAPPFTDPNAVAEAVVEIIRSAGQRGTVNAYGIE